jgi:hypothetical protein
VELSKSAGSSQFSTAFEAVPEPLRQACTELQKEYQALQAIQQKGEEQVLRQLAAVVRSKLQCKSAGSEGAVLQALRHSVRVMTLYPRCMWHTRDGCPQLSEEQGGYSKLQLFMQGVAAAAQQREAEQEELLQLKQQASAASAVFADVPEMFNLAVRARDEGPDASSAEVLVQVLQELQQGWAASIGNFASFVAPGGHWEQQLQQLVVARLQQLVQQCTAERAVENILLAVAPQLASNEYVQQLLLQGKGLHHLVKEPVVAQAVCNTYRSLSRELTGLLRHGATRLPAGVS